MAPFADVRRSGDNGISVEFGIDIGKAVFFLPIEKSNEVPLPSVTPEQRRDAIIKAQAIANAMLDYIRATNADRT